ncbi:MAG TPA: c-type cytochrome [Woeseiaceae bacterium]|nr:c-type cytochrome [Woeseiaceae bacterium]
MRRYGLACLMLAVLCVPGASASLAGDAPVIPPDEFVYCTVCHGAQMKGNRSIEAPRLSGMDAGYIERQLHAFKQGWRGTHENDKAGMEMRPMAAILKDREIAAAARYVNSVSSEPPPATVEGDAARGEVLYATCAACHGPNAEGIKELGSPALSGLNDWYLVTQLLNFRDSTRGGHPHDTYGAQMRAAASVLPDDAAVQDVVSYIATLQSR